MRALKDELTKLRVDVKTPGGFVREVFAGKGKEWTEKATKLVGAISEQLVVSWLRLRLVAVFNPGFRRRLIVMMRMVVPAAAPGWARVRKERLRSRDSN